MLHDMITNQWLWFSAAGIFAVFVGVFAAYSFYKLRPSRAIRNQQEKDGWSPTGRVDFIVDGSNNFISKRKTLESLTASVESSIVRFVGGKPRLMRHEQ